MRHPNGRCQHCGEPLRLIPCLNCQQLTAMNGPETEDGVSTDSGIAQRDVVAVSGGVDE